MTTSAQPSPPQLDDTDKIILNRIQTRFPIDARPYRTLAKEIGLQEEELIDRLQHLKSSGLVRRIGGNFSPDKLGFVSTLCAAVVPEDKIDLFTTTVNKYPGVTHNYQRENRFNIWFTFIASSPEIIAKNLLAITEETGVSTILNLPATHVFKIIAKFDV